MLGPGSWCAACATRVYLCRTAESVLFPWATLAFMRRINALVASLASCDHLVWMCVPFGCRHPVISHTGLGRVCAATLELPRARHRPHSVVTMRLQLLMCVLWGEGEGGAGSGDRAGMGRVGAGIGGLQALQSSARGRS